MRVRVWRIRRRRVLMRRRVKRVRIMIKIYS